MVSLQSVTTNFLKDQKERLKEKTYRDYEDVMEMYTYYLNGYGPNHIDYELKAQWEKAFETDEEAFVKIVPISEISMIGYFEFINYFVYYKVSDSKYYLNTCRRVLKKFTKWLYENKYIDQEDYDDLMAELDME